MHRYDAIVLGAGPTGGTAAAQLARAGWSVALVERKCFPRRKVCGEYVSAGTWRLLYDLGLGEAAMQHAGPAIERAAVFAGDTQLIFAMPRPDGPVHWGHTIGREYLDLFSCKPRKWQERRSGSHGKPTVSNTAMVCGPAK